MHQSRFSWKEKNALKLKPKMSGSCVGSSSWILAKSNPVMLRDDWLLKIIQDSYFTVLIYFSFKSEPKITIFFQTSFTLNMLF